MGVAIPVLIVTPQLSTGGAEHQVVTLAIELKKIGCRPIVISRGGEKENQLRKESILHIAAPIDKKDIASFIQSFRILRKVTKEYNISLIHCHAVIPTLISRIATIGKNIPIVSTGHGWPRSSLSTVVNILKRTTDHQIAISKCMQQDFVRLGFPPEKISVIYNSINLSDFEGQINVAVRQELGAQPNQILLGMVARMNETRKGHSILFKALKELTKEFKNIRLAVIGDGLLREKLELEVQELNLTEFICFTGNLQDMQNVYPALDLLVLPSLWEGLPIVVLEAMAAAKPVVATAVNGTPETIIDGKTGILVRPNDSIALANGIRELILNKDKAVAMGLAGKELVKDKFSSTEMAQKTKNLYFQLLGKTE